MYNIDLSRADLSWRKFINLVIGLNSDNATFPRIMDHIQKTKVEYIASAEDVAQSMLAAMGTKKKKK